MGELKIKLPNELEKLFRKIAMHRFGFAKGAISHAAKEAIEEWTEEGAEPEINFNEMKGILKKTKKMSVELQHDAWKKIAKKHAARR